MPNNPLHNLAQFAIRFLICNFFIIAVIGTLLPLKHFLRSYLSPRIQYNLWFLLFGIMIIPFVPFHFPAFGQFFQLLNGLSNVTETGTRVIGKFDPSMMQTSTTDWANDFAVSVSRNSPALFAYFVCSVWIVGMIAMMILFLHSKRRLGQIKKSALPLQNREIQILFEECKHTLRITSYISVYSTAFLKSPVTMGILHPQIYVPIHLISDYLEKDMRYILLHELQHYRYKDAIPNKTVKLSQIRPLVSRILFRYNHSYTEHICHISKDIGYRINHKNSHFHSLPHSNLQ